MSACSLHCNASSSQPSFLFAIASWRCDLGTIAAPMRGILGISHPNFADMDSNIRTEPTNDMWHFCNRYELRVVLILRDGD
jgi:hypothetical protein